MNQLQAIAMNEGIRRKRGLWTEKGPVQLESLRLPPWTTRRRQELLELLNRFDPSIDQLRQAIEQEAERMPEGPRLQTHPGVGPITALAFVLVLGTPDRFRCGKQVASYLGLIPCEDSSAQVDKSAVKVDSAAVLQQVQRIRTALDRVKTMNRKVTDVRSSANEIQIEAEALRDEVRASLVIIEDSLRAAVPKKLAVAEPTNGHMRGVMQG